MLTPREKSCLPENISSEEDRTQDAASSRTSSPTHYQRAIPARFLPLNQLESTFAPPFFLRRLSLAATSSPSISPSPNRALLACHQFFLAKLRFAGVCGTRAWLARHQLYLTKPRFAGLCGTRALLSRHELSLAKPGCASLCETRALLSRHELSLAKPGCASLCETRALLSRHELSLAKPGCASLCETRAWLAGRLLDRAGALCWSCGPYVTSHFTISPKTKEHV